MTINHILPDNNGLRSRLKLKKAKTGRNIRPAKGKTTAVKRTGEVEANNFLPITVAMAHINWERINKLVPGTVSL